MSNSAEPPFAALGDPTRRQILELLARGQAKTPTELADLLPITRQGVSKHLLILEQAGLVQVRQAGREKHYSLNPETLEAGMHWMQAIAAQWDRRLQALQQYLAEDESTE